MSCVTTLTDTQGKYQVNGLDAGDYVVTAFPPAQTSLLEASIFPLTLAASQGLSGQDIVLKTPTPPPAGTTITSNHTVNGVPAVFWNQPLTLTTHGCSGATAAYSVLSGPGGATLAFGAMAEGPSGTYTATIAPLTPLHGPVSVQTKINCPGNPTVVAFDMFIDPSGVVKRPDGTPLRGVTLSLFRADSLSGVMTHVPNGSGIMDFSNQNNPDLTDASGVFGWNVVAGFYKVRAEKTNCVSPTNAAQPFVESAILTIPPAVTDLDLRLACPPSVVENLDSPQRIADSRITAGLIGTGQSRCFGVAGLAGIQNDAAAVVLNVTAVGYGTQGWLSVYPSGQAVPATSTVNFDTSEYAMANGTLMRLGSDGKVCVNVGTINSAPGGSQVILDATGYLTAGDLAALPMLTSPQRVVDTRVSSGAIQTGQSRCFTVAGVAGVPADAAAVVLNVTAVGYATKGWLSVFPNGQSVPATSILNFDTSEYAIANGTIMRVGSGGQVCVNVGTINSLPGSSQAILDVTGYLTSTGLGSLAMIPSPQRVADTRTAGGPIASGAARCFTVAGVAGIPANALAVVVNVTAVGYGTQGWLTAYPNGQAVPATSTLNFDPSEYAMANGTVMAVGTGGQVCVNVGTINGAAGNANVLLDVVGYLAP